MQIYFLAWMVIIFGNFVFDNSAIISGDGKYSFYTNWYEMNTGIGYRMRHLTRLSIPFHITGDGAKLKTGSAIECTMYNGTHSTNKVSFTILIWRKLILRSSKFWWTVYI